MNTRVAVTATLAAMLFGLFHTLSGRAIHAQAQKSQWDGIYMEEQAKRGEGLYQQYCAACHGPDMGGGEMAPALLGGEFSANWNELSVGDLFERIRIYMPQNSPGTLSREQNADILAFILMRGNYPAGARELPTQTELLKQYRFLAVKPAP
jgi:mono/diheme cytochrome c family protein